MVGTEVGIGETQSPPTDVRGTPKYQRHPLGRSWLIAVAVIPLLLAAIGYGAYERPQGVNGPTGALPTLTNTAGPSAGAGLSLSLLSISRNGNTITLIGDFPDDSSKAAMMTALQGSLPPGVNIIDQVHIDPIVRALDFSKAAPVFVASAQIPDFTLKVERNTVTLAGTAVSGDQRDAIERAAVSAWPGVDIANRIEAKPPPAPPGQCNDLQAAINAVTGGPIFFGSDGVSLTPADNQMLTQVAAKLKACPNARVTVNGYADNSGGEAMNIPLSTQRATAVAEYLVKNGVAADHVASKGLGSANPIASNDTAEGRIKNRRVELVVS